MAASRSTCRPWRSAGPLQSTGDRTALDFGNRHQPLACFTGALLALDARVVLRPPGTDPDCLPRPAIRPYPSQYVSSWMMKNGASVLFMRPIRPEDEPLMVKFHETLSDRSVYLRYFYTLISSSRVAHDRLVRICFVDYDREMAIVAEQRDTTGERRILAVGRLVKFHAKNEGEVAVLVSDVCQNQGLGTELFRRVVQVARDENLARVEAEILPDNLPMKKIAKRLGFRASAFGRSNLRCEQSSIFRSIPVRL